MTWNMRCDQDPIKSSLLKNTPHAVLSKYPNTAKFISRQRPVQARSIRQAEEREDGLHQAPDPGAGERVRRP